MKYALILLVALLGGCVTMQEDPRLSQELAWTRQTALSASAGQVKFSDFYKEAYDRLARLKVTPVSAVYLKSYATMIPIARRYEAGEITREQLDDERRNIRVVVNQELLQAEAVQRQAQADATQRFIDHLQRQQALTQQNAPVHCTSTRFGNTVQTNCR